MERMSIYVENFLKKFFILLTIFFFLKYVAVKINLQFDTFVYISFTVLLATAFFLYKLKIESFNLKANEDKRARKFTMMLLILFSILVGTFTASINAPEEDDTFYSSAVVYYLDNPTNNMNSNMNWLASWSDNKPLPNFFLEFSPTYEFFIGIVSYVLNIDFLWLYQVFGSFIWGTVFVYVYFGILNRFFKSHEALFGTLMIFFMLLFLFRQGGLGYGIFLSKLWLGKTILQIILIPFLATLVYDYIIRPTKTNWIFLFGGVTSSLAFSTSSLFLIPSLLVVLASGTIFNSMYQKQKDLFFTALKIVSSGSVLLLFGLYTREKITNVLTTEISQLSGGVENKYLFENAFQGLFGKFNSFPILILCLSILIVVANYKKFNFIVMWMFSSIFIFVNPLTSEYVALYLTSSISYSRIFNIVPWLIIVGMFFAILNNYLANKIKSFLVSNLIIFTLAFALINYFSEKTLEKSFGVDNYAYWLGKPGYAFPRIKIDEALLRDVEEITKVLPFGNTLSTLQYSYSIPMISGHHPQYYSNPYSTVLMFGKMSNHNNDSEIRSKAIEYLLTVTDKLREFEIVIQSNVDNLVIDTWTDNKMNIKTIAIRNGFFELKRTNRYVLYTKTGMK